MDSYTDVHTKWQGRTGLGETLSFSRGRRSGPVHWAQHLLCEQFWSSPGCFHALNGRTTWRNRKNCNPRVGPGKTAPGLHLPTPAIHTSNETQKNRTQKAESFPLQPVRCSGVSRAIKGPGSSWRRKVDSSRFLRGPRWFHTTRSFGRLWKVTDYAPYGWSEGQQRGTREVQAVAWVLGPQLPVPRLAYSQRHKKGYRGSSVVMQVGMGRGGGCCFSRIKDKLLKNLNKDL